MTVETVAYQQTEHPEASTQVTDVTASNVGRTVFELLAKPIKAHESSIAYSNSQWTIQPTYILTGQPPKAIFDEDREPETVDR